MSTLCLCKLRRFYRFCEISHKIIKLSVSFDFEVTPLDINDGGTFQWKLNCLLCTNAMKELIAYLIIILLIL